MTDIQASDAGQVLTTKDNEAKTNALIAYGLLVGGLFTGLLWLVGGIWAMVKKNDAQGTLFFDHYQNIVSLFWWTLGLSIVGILLSFVVIGFIVLFGVWVWSIYRIVKGLSLITSNKPYKS